MLQRKLTIAGLFILLAFVLTGCGSYNDPISADSSGIWSHYFVFPLYWFIKHLAEWLGGSYGLAIIVSTIIIRLILLPLMIKQTKSSKAMQDIQPEMKKLKEKYSSKDAETQKKLQEETMKLFQHNNVNPLAGCFPLIIQMPILIAFYHAINRAPEIKTHEFLWFSLGQPDYVLPLVAALTTFLQQKLMLGRAGNANPQMKIMVYVFPVMIAVIGFNLPSALALYWVVGNLFMIIQTYFITAPKKQEKEAGGVNK